MPYRSLALVLTDWRFDPTAVAWLVVVAIGYVWLTRLPYFQVARGLQAGFWAGLAVLALVLFSPLDELADAYLFSAHMLQHLIMIGVSAPLLVHGLPARLLAPLKVKPMLAYLIFNVLFVFSHVPSWYEATLHSDTLHALEHLVYVGTAALAWLPVLSPAHERRLSYALQTLYLFAQTIPMFLLGALLTLGDSPLYPTYQKAPRLIPFSPLEDQSLGGLMMWIGGSFFYLGVLTIVFFRWANRDSAPDLLPEGKGSWPHRNPVWREV